MKRFFYIYILLLIVFNVSAVQASGYNQNGANASVYSGYYAAYFPYGRPLQDSERNKILTENIKQPAPNNKKIKTKINTSEAKKAAKNQKVNRKSRFIDKVLPLIIKSNQEISRLRNKIIQLCGDAKNFEQLSVDSQKWIKRIAKRYKIQHKKSDFIALKKELLNRVNTVDPALALAQAALESGWGSSRFTREANNIFGIWTYDESKGLIPKKRDPNKKHFVRVFADLEESVSHYMYNLNTHSAYEKFRNIRALQEYIYTEEPTFLQLDGLEKYSELGQEYLKRVKKVIEYNNLVEISQNYIDRLNKLNGLAFSNSK